MRALLILPVAPPPTHTIHSTHSQSAAALHDPQLGSTMQPKVYEPTSPTKGREARPPCSLLHHLEEQHLPPGPPSPYRASEEGKRCKPKSQSAERGDPTAIATDPYRRQERQPMFPNGDAAFKTAFKGRSAPAATPKTSAASPTITGVQEAGRQTGILIKAHTSLNSRRLEAKQAYAHHTNDLVQWRDIKQDIDSTDLTEDAHISRGMMTRVQHLSEVVKRHDNQRGDRRIERWQALAEQVRYHRDAAIAVNEEVSFHPTLRERCEINRIEGRFNDAVREQNDNDKRYNELVREFWPHKVPDLCLRAMPFREFSE